LTIDKNIIKKILLIKFGGIGDVVLFTPVLSNLRNYFPEAKISVLIEKKAEEIIKDNPFKDSYITFVAGQKDKPSLYRKIRKERFNAVFDFYGNPRTALISFFSKARYRIGFDFRIRKYAYNIVASGYSSEIHNLDFNLRLLQSVNIPVLTKDIVVFTNNSYRDFAKKWFRNSEISSRKIIGIVIACGWDSKVYPPKHYIELLNLIDKKYLVNFLLFWGNKNEKSQAEEIRRGLGNNCYLAPDLKLKDLTEFFKYCTVIIGNDSGPLHLSVTSGNPVLEISGPINPHLQGPYGEQNEYIYLKELDCLFCNLLKCPIGNKCMTDLPKIRIIEAFEKLLSKNKIIIEKI